MSASLPQLSIVIPCYNEEESLPACVKEVQRYMASRAPGSTETILVDDGSTDRTWSVLTQLVNGRPYWRAIRLITNRGSHIALRCGYRHATGERVVNLPVDLQEPIENIDRLIEAMDRTGVEGVLAVRGSRADGWFARITSRLYHGAMHLVNLKNVPIEGTSQFLLTRKIAQQINAHNDRGFTFEGFLASAPLRLEVVWYDRAAAPGRVSRWTFPRKVQHALNTIVGFSNVPIRTLSMVGALVALGGLLSAAFASIRFSMTGATEPGRPSLMTVVLVLGGLNLLALGLVGEYVWRILDETRHRPLYQIEDSIGLSLASVDERHVHEHAR